MLIVIRFVILVDVDFDNSSRILVRGLRKNEMKTELLMFYPLSPLKKIPHNEVINVPENSSSAFRRRC